MLNLRDKDISLIKKFFKLSTLQNSAYIPFIIAGTENGSGHNMIIRKIQHNKGYDKISFVTCHEFILDAFRPIYQIIKSVIADPDFAEIEDYSEVLNWLNDYEHEKYSLHSEDFLIKLLSEFLIKCSKIKSILLILENLHFGSYFLLNFLNQLAIKMENTLPRYPLNILAFYRFEEFIDVSLKKLIAEISEKGMVITVRNIPQNEYLTFIEPLFNNYDQEIIQKLWSITKGNILIFTQVMDYASKKIKPQDGKFDLMAIVNLLPNTTKEFYYLYLSKFTRLENEILETIAFITAPVNQSLLEFITKEQPQIIARTIRRLLKEKLISQTSFVSERYNLASFDLRNYILYRNSNEYKLGRFRFILEKYEQFYKKDLDKQLLIFRNLAIQAVDKSKIYYYLKKLYATLPNNYNSFRRIEILYQLVMYETDVSLLPDYVIKLCCSLIEVNKNKSAIEILKKYGRDKNLKSVDAFRINLLLFELYISLEYFNSSLKLSEMLDKLFNPEFTKYLQGIYHMSKIRYLIAVGKFSDALRAFAAGIYTNDSDREYYLIYKAEILFCLGYLNNSRRILLEVYSVIEERKDYYQLCIILLKLAEIEEHSGNFNKADQYLKSCQNISPLCEESNKFPVKTLIGLSNLNLHQKNYKQALSYLYAALNIENSQNNSAIDSEIFSSLGIYYQENNSYEKSISCFKRAKYNYLGYENMKKRIFYTLSLAECYAWFYKKEESEKYFLEVENFIRNDVYSQYKDSFFLSRARAAMYLKEFDNALSYLEDMICREDDRVIFIEKTLLEMRIGYQIRNNSLIKDSAEILKPFFNEYGSYILYEVNLIKGDTDNQQGLIDEN